MYSLTGTTRVSHEEHGEFKADKEGGFELPPALGEQLRGTHIGGQKAWEDDGERSLRLLVEDEARRRDPATLLAAVERLAAREAPAPAQPNK